MKLKKLTSALLATLAFGSSVAGAVTLGEHGKGQVLIYPYYTVNGGNSSVVHVSNGTTRVKALRVAFSEAHNHREVLGFNVYLAPFSTWSATIAASGDTDPAALSTDSAICTVPSLPDATSPQAFLPYAYDGSIVGDAGPQDLSRTREGMLEIFELGTLAPGSRSEKAANLSHGVPKDCKFLVEQWSGGGAWETDPSKDILNPTGGLSGGISIVNVASGTTFDYPAIALDDFRSDPTDAPRGRKSTVQFHSAPYDMLPSLANALTEPTKMIAGADVKVGGKMVHADYSADHAIDAVTAVLMDQRIAVDFRKENTVPSEWVVNFPTRNFYADAMFVGASAIPPFGAVYPDVGGVETAACEPVAYAINGKTGAGPFGVPNVLPSCYTVQTIPLSQTSTRSPQDASFLHSSMATLMNNGGPLDFGYTSGTTSIDFGTSATRPSLDGKVFHGSPSIGFAVTKNGSVATQSGSPSCTDGAHVCK